MVKWLRFVVGEPDYIATGQTFVQKAKTWSSQSPFQLPIQILSPY